MLKGSSPMKSKTQAKDGIDKQASMMVCFFQVLFLYFR